MVGPMQAQHLCALSLSEVSRAELQLERNQFRLAAKSVPIATPRGSIPSQRPVGLINWMRQGGKDELLVGEPEADVQTSC